MIPVQLYSYEVLYSYSSIIYYGIWLITMLTNLYSDLFSGVALLTTWLYCYRMKTNPRHYDRRNEELYDLVTYSDWLVTADNQ